MFNPENYNSSKAEPTDLQIFKLLYSYIVPVILEGILHGGEPPYILHITNHDQLGTGIWNFQLTSFLETEFHTDSNLLYEELNLQF